MHLGNSASKTIETIETIEKLVNILSNQKQRNGKRQHHFMAVGEYACNFISQRVGGNRKL